MKRITALLLVLGLLMGCLAAAEGFAYDYARMNEAAASALILTLYDENGKQTGAAGGFMAFDDRHAVTAFDAVTGAAKVEITTDAGELLGAFKMLGCDSDCNLAILAFDEPTGLSPLEINESGEVRRGAACVSIAAQDGFNAINTGNISNSFSDSGYDLIQFTAPVGEGVSGSALLDEYGRVAGVTMLGLSGESSYAVVQNMNFALSATHLMELWNYCKDDEPVEIKDWEVTDIGASAASSRLEPRFTLVSNWDYSIASLSVDIKDAATGDLKRISKEYTWLRSGSSTVIELNEKIDDPEALLVFNVKMSFSGNIQADYRLDDVRAGDILGRTVIFTYDVHTYKIALTPETPASEPRHTKEAREASKPFEIPEILDRPLPENICIVVNETPFNMIDVYIGNGTDPNKNFASAQEPVYPGEYVVVEIPQKLLDGRFDYWWRFEAALYGGRWTSFTIYETSDVAGRVIVITYDDAQRKVNKEVR